MTRSLNTSSSTNNIAHQPTKTIAAIATPQGRGGVGIIRLSGSKALEITEFLTQKPDSKGGFKPNVARFVKFYAADGTVLDEGLVLYFKAPHSFTGEDVVELHGHGGVVLQQMLLERVFGLGATQATAGEFSARAFDNDKLDLVQAEAIADAIDATSQAAAKSALRSLTGEFSDKINGLLEQLVHLRLHVEAAIDFPEEEDVDFLADGVIESKLTVLQQGVGDVLDNAKQGQLLRDGVHVVIAGKPNAGKSSLLNRLAGQERAIVTDIAGTTRDILQETVNLNGLTLTLTDTAGLRDTDDVVEKIGIDRAHDAIKTADLLLLVHDLTENEDPLVLAEQLYADHFDSEQSSHDSLLIIGNKHDLAPSEGDMNILDGYTQINISCFDGSGLERLIEEICTRVGFRPPENSIIARTRHVDALKRVQTNLSEAREQLVVNRAGELVAESLRISQQALGEITGEFSADDLLGEIFGSFCIGK